MPIPLQDAMKKLAKSEFKLLKNSPYRIPIIVDAKYEDVKAYMSEIGYTGEFGVIRPLKTQNRKKTSEVDNV